MLVTRGSNPQIACVLQTDTPKVALIDLILATVQRQEEAVAAAALQQRREEEAAAERKREEEADAARQRAELLAQLESMVTHLLLSCAFPVPCCGFL